MALIVTLMVMMLISALLVGFTTMVSSNMRMSGLSGTGTSGFYTALAGSEKLTSDLGALFSVDISPSGDAVRALGDDPPSMDGVSWLEPDGSDGYRIEFETTTGNPLTGDPVSTFRTVTGGPYAGFIGLVTQYEVITTAKLLNGAERSLSRVLQTVSIPVFQFGTFSETDLGFHPGPVFDFGGRVHSNGNIFLTASNQLVLSDKVTAVGEIVRAFFMNGNSSASRTGDIDVLTTPGNYRDLKIDEGSVVGDENSAPNEPTWTNLSTGVYNGNIRSGSTGVTRLDLPIVTQGASPVDLVQRPPANEDVNGFVFAQRHFAIASMRILLSDTAAEITSLPTVTVAAPLPLDDQVDTGGDPLNPWAGYAVGANTPPLARSNGNQGEGYVFPVDETSHGGFIKVEIQNATGTWIDVTTEILNLGIAGRNLTAGCAEPNPNAVLRLQRLRYDGNLVQPGATGCGDGSTSGYDYWPNVLYDAREGVWRDNISQFQMNVYLSGVMHYIELDVNNLRRWLDGTIGVSGPNVLDQNGFVIYFSDRRLNKNALGNETGELGMEDFVNPQSGSATPNGILDTGEDLNGNTTLETYGNVPQSLPVPPLAPYDGNATLRTLVNINVARANRPIFFRRALKLTNGALNQVPMPGIMVTSENPMYIEGDFNASVAAGGFVEPNAAAAVMADAVTFLSNGWTDTISLAWPHRETNRNAQTTWYRVAIISGKGMAFPRPSGTFTNFGTDGGTHNFFRMLEDWGGRTANYRGAMITFYNNRQAVGPWQCCNNTYSPPTRAYAFDVDFLDPNQLPPATPTFRDVNVMGFTHRIIPDQ